MKRNRGSDQCWGAAAVAVNIQITPTLLAPRPCKAYFRRAGEPREFGWLLSVTKLHHANQSILT